MKTYLADLHGVEQSHSTPRQWVKISFILAVANLIAIITLSILAAIVYHRLAFDNLSPPVYSIWVRPGEKWHHVEFVISPYNGFQMTID